MRHRIHHRKLNRTSEHRRALNRNMAQSLIEHGQIKTTLPKAKNIRPFVEKLVTLALKVRRSAAAADRAGSLRARRRIHRLLGERSMIAAAHRVEYWGMSEAKRNKVMRMPSGRRHRAGEPKGKLAFTAESVVHRLIENVAARYEDRPGGYTRVIRLAQRRIGDNAPLAVVQLVGDEQAPTSLTKPARSARKRRADSRYRLAIKLSKGKSAKEPAPEPVAEPPAEPEAVVEEPTDEGTTPDD